MPTNTTTTSNQIGLNRPKDAHNVNTNISNQNPINNNNFINNIFCDREFLLAEENENNITNENEHSINCPEINVKIGQIEINALLDTGSNVTCMSEQWYSDNFKQIGTHEKLPVTNTYVRTATNGKSKRIPFIIMVPLTVQEQVTQIQIILVPYLIRPLIIGMDTISTWKMAMNFDDNIIKMNINNKNIELKFGDVKTDGILCYIVGNNRQRQNEYNYYNNNESWSEDEEDNNLNITYETVTETLNNNENLNEQQKQQLSNLIMQFQNIMSDRPGKCNVYEHTLKVDHPQNFKTRNYPVPLVHQEAPHEDTDCIYL